jgi:superfamily II DNA/RNA helicase
MENFKNLGIDTWLARNLAYLRYEQPTPVQKEAIPLIMDSKTDNSLFIANTGTGKTAAFCVPLLNMLAQDPSGIFAIILEPTRELAVQVKIFVTVIPLGIREIKSICIWV